MSVDSYDHHQPPEFVTSVLGSIQASDDDHFPRVTLTFAQSLDAKLAAEGGKQLALSGKECMTMTHWMRARHDAILVGVHTVINDDPRLNTRLLPPKAQEHSPIPVVLDSRLRTPVRCKLLKNYQEGRGKRPYIICSSSSGLDLGLLEEEKLLRKRALEDAGASVFEVPTEDGYLSIPAVLRTLHDLGVRSLMVEGGGQIIQSFLSEAMPDKSGKSIVHRVIITIAHFFVGEHGVGYHLDESRIPPLRHLRTESIGRNAIMAMEIGSD